MTVRGHAPSSMIAWKAIIVRSRRFRQYGPPALAVLLIALVYRGWLSSGAINYGDWEYQSLARLRDYWPIPPLWDGASATGGANILQGPAFPLLTIEGLLAHIHVSATLIERLVWIVPGVVGGALAIYALAVIFFSSRLAGIIGALFAVTNSYIALVLTGGQLTVGTATLLMPLTLLLFYRAVDGPRVARFLLTALSIAVQIMFDLRSAYLTIGVLLLFTLQYVLAQHSIRQACRKTILVIVQFAAMGIIVLLVNLAWLLPGHYSLKNSLNIALPGGYDSMGWVYALSYMKLSHAFALYHPWWYSQADVVEPVYLPFFLLPLPIFFIFLKRHLTYVELFLFSTAILSIFFVKGSNPPAGNIYVWMFAHFPGFDMFRDPSKFYQPLGFAYALLLGRAATVLFAPTRERIVRLTPNKERMMRRLRTALGGLVALFCCFLVLQQALPVAENTRWGTLAPKVVPADYLAFNRFIDRQGQFFRIMWYPGGYSFASSSSLHPSIGIDTLGSPAVWRKSRAQKMLRALSVKYIVVADSPDAAVANTSPQTRAIQMLRQAFPSFPEIRFGGIHLFLNRSYLPAAFIPAKLVTSADAQMLLQRATTSSGPSVGGVLGEFSSACLHCLTVTSLSATRYDLTVQRSADHFLLILNQSFDPNWIAYIEPSSGKQPFWWTWTHPGIASRYHVTVNGFANAWWLDASGARHIVIEYWPERLADLGWLVGWLTILTCLFVAVWPPLIRWMHRLPRNDVPCDAAANVLTVETVEPTLPQTRRSGHG